jgi:menaquinone-9 beta-reductase
MRRVQTVCVAGGGPAGLAAEIALRTIGCAVTVVDCSTPPIDKACGEGLLPDSIAALRELGVELPAETGFAFRGIRFADRRSSAIADFPSGAARGVRRTALHQALIDRAEQAGVSTIWKAKHVRLADGGLSLDGRVLEADLVVGADGQNSQIRRQAGLDRVSREKRRYAFRRHYRVRPWTDYMELHWGRRAQVYVTPVAADQVCVAAISRYPRVRLDDALQEISEVRQRVANLECVSAEAGAMSVSRRLESVCRGNVVLVGDASGSVDAITGEGMCLGFRQALALAQAVQANDRTKYERAHRKLARRPRTMAALMLLLERSPSLQRSALAALARYPEVFRSLVAVHVGAIG